MHENRINASQNGNGGALRELAARLLAPPYPSDRPSAESEKPQLFVGHPPDGMLSEVPIPNDATVIGGAAHWASRGRRYFEIVLDAEQSAEHFREAYRQRLLAAGWRDDDRFPERSGFVPRGLPRLFHYAASRSSRLRRRLRGRVPGLPELLDHSLLGERGSRLMVTARDRQDAPTDVRLSLVLGQREPLLRHEVAHTIIPSLFAPSSTRALSGTGYTNTLHAPPGAREMGGGADYGEPDGAYSYAVLQTGLDLAALTAHYAAQLEEAGWTRTDEGESGAQAWSMWTLRDEKGRLWAGTFTALRLAQAPGATSGRYLLQIHAGLTSEQSGSPTAEAE